MKQKRARCPPHPPSATVSGFAGSTADCLALRERLEAKLEVGGAFLLLGGYMHLGAFALPRFALYRRTRGSSPVPA